MPANTKKRILCFGDSNTWGYIPNTDHQRFDENSRYPKVLQKLLGEDYEIIEEGLNSRTLKSEDLRPGKDNKNGSKHLIPCLEAHDPIDLIILMIGINELKHSYQKTAYEAAQVFEDYYIKVILNRRSASEKIIPKILIVSTTKINESVNYAKERFLGGNKKSEQLSELYENIANKYSCDFVSAIDLEIGEDGVHLTEKSHQILAQRLNQTIQSKKL